jgi:hypothetical protein
VASKDEPGVSMELLESFLEKLESRSEPTPFSPRERQSLEQLAVAVMSGGEITISKELLEGFSV